MLITFVKNECANYNKHYEVCLDDKPCKILDGKRCGHFVKCVLGPGDYKFRLPGHDYQRLFAQYAEQTNTETQVVQQRRCDCGEPLKSRQRFCGKCSQKRRKQSNRKYNRNRDG